MIPKHTILNQRPNKPVVHVWPPVSSVRRPEPPLSMYNPPPFNRVPSLGGRPAVNHAANFTSGDFSGWLPRSQHPASPTCHPITPSSVTSSSQKASSLRPALSLPVAIPRRLKCRAHASTSSSGGDTQSDASSAVEGHDAVLATVSPCTVQAAAEAACADLSTPCVAPGRAADCLEAALSGGLSSILYKTPETSPLPSPRMGPLYNVFTETVSPMLSPMRTTRW